MPKVEIGPKAKTDSEVPKAKARALLRLIRILGCPKLRGPEKAQERLASAPVKGRKGKPRAGVSVLKLE